MPPSRPPTVGRPTFPRTTRYASYWRSTVDAEPGGGVASPTCAPRRAHCCCRADDLRRRRDRVTVSQSSDRLRTLIRREDGTMRTTILAVLMLTIATGADAQGKRELEFGGGFHFWNLMQHYDFSDFPTGPTVDLTWVRWGERWGGAFGVSGVLNRVDVRRRVEWALPDRARRPRTRARKREPERDLDAPHAGRDAPASTRGLDAGPADLGVVRSASAPPQHHPLHRAARSPDASRWTRPAKKVKNGATCCLLLARDGTRGLERGFRPPSEPRREDRLAWPAGV